MEYAKRTWGKHTPFHSLLFLSLWGHGGRVGLVLGGLLPSDGLLLVYFPLAQLDFLKEDIPMAAMMVTMQSFPSSKAVSISLPRSVSGTLTSSLEFPSPSIKLRKPWDFSSIPTIAITRAHILNVDELVLGSGDVGDIHVVGLTISFGSCDSRKNL